MKKVLLASAALVASAGFAAADATVGGYGFAGIKYDGATDDVTVAHAVRLTFTANVETDNGVSLTAFTRTTVTGAGDGTETFERQRVDIAAAGLSARVGSTHGAAKTLARAAAFYGFDDGDVIAADNNTSVINDSGNNVLVQYTTGSFTVGVASTIGMAGGDEQDIGVKYSSGNITVGAGYATDESWMLALAYNFGQGSVKVGAGEDAAGNMELTGILSYNIGSATTLGVLIDDKDTNTDTIYGLDVSHDMGGATLSGTVGSNGAGDVVAGFGVFFGF
ncbi:porin [Mesobacterium pallidum]|uniref:porin n=1 Tax=Mesobacterium pallidum TaxID=2872037 RepID=UPI001EE292D6|nr:porin [Mesobacterium pallidum]